MAFFLVILTAFIAGVVNAVAGGGTFLTFPALTWYGLDQQVANMTSTIGLWPGSASSVAAARSEFSRLPRGMVIAFSAISLIGGAAGALILRNTSPRSFELVIPWLLAFATVVFAFSKPIAGWAGRQQGHRTLGWTIFVAAVQIFISIYGGYFGAGIGVLMLAGLSFAGLDDIHQMNALKVLLSTLINAIAAVIFMFSHRINWSVAAAMAVASILGGFWGMAVARKVKPDNLRAVILLIGVSLTAVYFAQNYFHAFDSRHSKQPGGGQARKSIGCNRLPAQQKAAFSRDVPAGCRHAEVLRSILPACASHVDASEYLSMTAPA